MTRRKRMARNKASEVSWQDVLYEWLSHEYVARKDFHNFFAHNKRAIKLITNPDLMNRNESVARLKMLKKFRTYLSQKYFTKRAWSLQTFNQSALDKLLLPVDTGWKYISGGSYKPSDAAKTMLRNPKSINPKYRDSLKYVAQNYKRLSQMKHKLIVVGNSPKKLQIVEGAHRLTAIFYRKLKEPKFAIKPMKIYCGINKK